MIWYLNYTYTNIAQTDIMKIYVILVDDWIYKKYNFRKF